MTDIIDWEYAAFIPDPEDYFLRGVSRQERAENPWWSLFDGVADLIKATTVHRSNEVAD